MNPKQQKWVLVIGGFLVLLIIGRMLPNKQTKISTEDVEVFSQPSSDAAPQQGTTHTKWDAFGICTQIANNKYGNADFELIDAHDMGEDDWIITGAADIEGKSIRWTGEVKYDLSTDKWDIKGWTDNVGF